MKTNIQSVWFALWMRKYLFSELFLNFWFPDSNACRRSTKEDEICIHEVKWDTDMHQPTPRKLVSESRGKASTLDQRPVFVEIVYFWIEPLNKLLIYDCLIELILLDTNIFLTIVIGCPVAYVCGTIIAGIFMKVQQQQQLQQQQQPEQFGSKKIQLRVSAFNLLLRKFSGSACDAMVARNLNLKC